MLSKAVSRTIFLVFGMTRTGIEPRSPGAMWAWWTLLVMDPNLGPGTCAWLYLKLESKVLCYTRVAKVSMMQLTHPKVTQQKLEAFWPQFCHGELTVQQGCQTVRWTVNENALNSRQCEVLGCFYVIDVNWLRTDPRKNNFWGWKGTHR